jgi:hypothetical protein
MRHVSGEQSSEEIFERGCGANYLGKSLSKQRPILPLSLTCFTKRVLFEAH